ncbi:unnamed protein product [Prorocentrum cordatum]|uniref:t-SNARE coiled-coil homology domain-containing protein n=1 Tax=Prorocentrum cordatum TaxID=2364126 RepID=A0ABN9XW83_9DINO|nr:unnamed protein product [Polarella glacialis]
MAERYRIDQRAALFGSRHGAKKAPVAATQIGAGQSQDAEALERQNEGHISELEARVSALKEITQSVGREVRESGSLIDSMNAGVAQAATTLRGTVSQLTQATSGRRDRTAALTGGFLLIFLIMYLLARRGGGGHTGAGGHAIPEGRKPPRGGNAIAESWINPRGAPALGHLQPAGAAPWTSRCARTPRERPLDEAAALGCARRARAHAPHRARTARSKTSNRAGGACGPTAAAAVRGQRRPLFFVCRFVGAPVFRRSRTPTANRRRAPPFGSLDLAERCGQSLDKLPDYGFPEP